MVRTSSNIRAKLTQVVWSNHAPPWRRLQRLITQRHRKCWCRTKSQKSNQQRTSKPLECQYVQSVAKCCLMLSIYIYVVLIPPSSMGRLQDVAMHPTWKNVIGSLTTFRQAIQSQGLLTPRHNLCPVGMELAEPLPVWLTALCTSFCSPSIWTSSSQRSSIIKSQWEWKVCEAKCWQH